MNITRDAVLTESPNFMNLGLLSVHTLDNSSPSSPPQPELEGRQMDPTGSHLAIVLVKLQRLERVGQGESKTIMLKLILKQGGKIKILGAKIIL